MRSLTTTTARRIAFIKPSALGDVVHALPALEAVRIRFPAAHITWIVNKSFAPMIEGHPAIDAVLSFDRGAMKKSPVAAVAYAGRFVKELRKRRFDLAIDLQGLLRSGLMALATGARTRIGLTNAREGSRFCYTHRIPAAGLLEQHAVDRNWLFAEALGVGDLPKVFRLPIRDAAKREIASRLKGLPRPFVSLAPGARWLTKRWPLEHFAELANRFQSKMDGTVFLAGGPEDGPMAEPLRKMINGPVVDQFGKTSLPELTALLNEMDAVVSNDSGPLHLAAALGRPVVAPYTCTKAALHGPYGQLHRGFETKVDCAGSYITTCPHMKCMAELTPDRLWPALEVVLRTWQSRSRSA